MTDTEKEERIRRRAHEIWEREGHPVGRHDHHWLQARQEVEDEERDLDSLQQVVTDAVGLVVGTPPETDWDRKRPPRAPAADEPGSSDGRSDAAGDTVAKRKRAPTRRG